MSEINGFLCESCGREAFVFTKVEDCLFVCDNCALSDQWTKRDPEDYFSETEVA